MLCWHVFVKISSEFRGILHVLVTSAGFHRFTWISQLPAKYQKPWNYELRHLHYTNWRLYFFSWLPIGDLKIFLILSTALVLIQLLFQFCHLLKKLWKPCKQYKLPCKYLILVRLAEIFPECYVERRKSIKHEKSKPSKLTSEVIRTFMLVVAFS